METKEGEARSGKAARERGNMKRAINCENSKH
jgi:hypothetical protein